MGKSARTFSTSRGGMSSYAGGITFGEAVIPASSRLSGNLRRPRAGEVALVPALLQPLGQLRATLLDDATADEDVHEVRRHVPQDPGVVGDEQDPGLAGPADPVDALAH